MVLPLLTLFCARRAGCPAGKAVVVVPAPAAEPADQLPDGEPLPAGQ
jgi:hypothetical protein